MKRSLSLLTILSVLFFFAPNSAYAVATTWNPDDKSAGVTLSNGNLTATGDSSATWKGVRGTVGKSSGKWYWEVTIVASGQWGANIGVGNSNCILDGVSRDDADCRIYDGDGSKHNGSTHTAYGNTYTTGDVMGIALDMTAGKIWWAKNGTWQASGDPGAGTGEAFSDLTGTMFPYVSLATNTDPAGVDTANFGATAFTYTPPTGFSGFDAAPSAPSVSIVGLIKSFWIW